MGPWIPIYCPFSILLNVSPNRFFPASRGFRQGDPLSPSVFTLIADSLSQINAESIGLVKGFYVGEDTVNVYHLQFANDTLILKDGEQSNMSIL